MACRSFLSRSIAGWLGAFQILIGSSVICGTFACSPVDGGLARTVPITKYSGVGECTSEGRTSAEFALYRCPVEGRELFMTAIEDCSVAEKFTHHALTRQLLVGFAQLSVLKQSATVLGDGHYLKTVAQGTLDADPITLVNFTNRNGRCVEDLIIWRNGTDAGTDSGAAAVSQLEADADRLVSILHGRKAL